MAAQRPPAPVLTPEQRAKMDAFMGDLMVAKPLSGFLPPRKKITKQVIRASGSRGTPTKVATKTTDSPAQKPDAPPRAPAPPKPSKVAASAMIVDDVVDLTETHLGSDTVISEVRENPPRSPAREPASTVPPVTSHQEPDPAPILNQGEDLSQRSGTRPRIMTGQQLNIAREIASSQPAANVEVAPLHSSLPPNPRPDIPVPGYRISGGKGLMIPPAAGGQLPSGAGTDQGEASHSAESSGILADTFLDDLAERAAASSDPLVHDLARGIDVLRDSHAELRARVTRLEQEQGEREGNRLAARLGDAAEHEVHFHSAYELMVDLMGEMAYYRGYLLSSQPTPRRLYRGRGTGGRAPR